MPPWGIAPFEVWVRRAASDLALHPQNPAFADGVPGLFAEAAAYLTSPEVLAPAGPPDWSPAVYERDRHGEGDTMLVALYGAAFGSPDPNDDSLEILVQPVSAAEDSEQPSGIVVGVLVGEERDRLLFSATRLRIPDLACTNVEDLRRVYRLVLSAADRV